MYLLQFVHYMCLPCVVSLWVADNAINAYFDLFAAKPSNDDDEDSDAYIPGTTESTFKTILIKSLKISQNLKTKLSS